MAQNDLEMLLQLAQLSQVLSAPQVEQQRLAQGEQGTKLQAALTALGLQQQAQAQSQAAQQFDQRLGFEQATADRSAQQFDQDLGFRKEQATRSADQFDREDMFRSAKAEQDRALGQGALDVEKQRQAVALLQTMGQLPTVAQNDGAALKQYAAQIDPRFGAAMSGPTPDDVRAQSLIDAISGKAGAGPKAPASGDAAFAQAGPLSGGWQNPAQLPDITNLLKLIQFQ